jgi:oxygen-dependent protoporphyrinogen oxidase
MFRIQDKSIVGADQSTTDARPVQDVRVPRRSVLAGLISTAAAGCLPSGLFAAETRSRGRTAVVIGAGIAGLSAGYELRKAGFDVSIFEKWEFVGGRMREAWMGPIWGPPHALGILEANKEMFALGDELGIGEQLAGDHASEEVFIDNGVGTYPRDLRFHVDEVQRIPGMSDETKRLLPRLQPDLDRIRRDVDPCLMTTGAAEDDESIAAYYERVLGKNAAKQVIDYWVDPVLIAWGWPVDSTSKMAILPWFAQQQARTVVPRGGIGVLTRKLGTVLPVQTRTTVRYVSPPDARGRCTVHYLTPEFEEKTVTPDVVVCATEGKFVASMIQGLSPPQRQFFESIDFTKAAGVSFVFDERHQPTKPAGGAYVPSHPELLKRQVSMWGVSPADPSAKGRPAMASIFLSRPEVLKWQVSGKTMPEYCLPLLQKFYPELTERVIADVVVTGCDDLIYMPVGYLKTAAQILREQEKSRRGLYFAGEFMAGAHTGAACASGRTVARTVAKHWV